MACYHFTSKPICRSGGQSAVHTAAYNARTQLENEREGRITKDYGDKGGLLFSGIFAPPGALDWVQDRNQLWNRAEAAERRVDAQTARNVEFALPHELTEEQRERLVKDFAREAFARKGMVADVSMHAPHEQGDQRNFHVHCLLTMRRLENEGFAATKEREWNSKAELFEWREKLAHMGGKALDKAGFHVEAERFKHGHETIEKQREAALNRGDLDFAETLDRAPTVHLGVVATAQERKGLQTDRAATAREQGGLADQIKATEAELAGMRKEAAQEQSQKREPEARAVEQAKQEQAAQSLERMAAREIERGLPEPPQGKRAAEIFTAYQSAHTGPEFAAALADRKFTLAQVTAKDVQRYDEARLAAQEAGNKRLPPKFQENEFVAVDEYGNLHRINERTTGASRDEIAAKTAGFSSCVSVKQAVDVATWTKHQAKMEKTAERNARRAEREAEFQKRWKKIKACRLATSAASTVVDKAKGTVHKTADAIGGVAKTANAALKMVDNVLDFFVSPPPPRKITRAEYLASAEARKEHQEQKAAEAKQERERAQSLETMRKDWQSGRGLAGDELRNLSRDDLESIKAHGIDDGLKLLVENLERERARGRERERERER